MTDDSSHTQQGQAERARRLRERIAALRSGAPSPPSGDEPKSLKEQIDERASEQKNKKKRA